MHNGFNIPNMSGTLSSRNSSMNTVASGGIQQSAGSVLGGRFASNNIPVALSQISHGSSHGGYSGVANRGGMNVGSPGYANNTNGVGGSIPGILPTSAAIGNRSAVPGLGVSPVLGNAGPRVSGSMGSMVGSGSIGRNISSGGGLSVPGLTSRLNMSTNTGSGSLGIQGPNRLSSGVLQQGQPVWLGSLGKRDQTLVRQEGKFSVVCHFITLRSTSFLSRSCQRAPLPYTTAEIVGNIIHIVCHVGLTVFGSASPQVLTMFGNSYPSAGGPLSQSHVHAVNSLSSMGMLSDENSKDSSPFTLNDFPQLGSRPNSAGGPQGQLGMRKQGLGVSPIVQQNQEFSIQNEDFPALPGFKGGNAEYGMDFQQKEPIHDNGVPMVQHQHFSNSMPPGISLRSMNSQGAVSGMGSYEQQFMQQYQQQQSQPQFRLQQMPSLNQNFRDQGIKSMQSSQPASDPFGLLGLLSVIRMSDPDLTSLALGIDLTTLGLNLNSSENLHKTFASPWSDEPAKGEPEFTIPECYYAKQPPALHQGYFARFSVPTLFYIFYSYNRGWFYHKDLRLWFTRVPNVEPLVKTNTYERSSYFAFDPNTWDSSIKENFVIHYEFVEKRPALHPQ
ncbi:hypothetical protein Cgig2_005045 [Carnegiea gigantea]|uniref:NOT2/NOT3/NOT5 C-terminal domain-containing protein n=1 Tax=Carnegiea gigantea TaxID=171969 RepID=A0A9Q1L1C6_9CARY|nr:hypothetical protein Cgig2_005045 [Carnegiea gigantea]